MIVIKTRQPDPELEQKIQMCIRDSNEGATMKESRDWLNENGIKNPVGGAFTYNSGEHMLKNRRYIGRCVEETGS